jgi:hypothetical protein
LKVNDISEKRVAAVFRVEKEPEQETRLATCFHAGFLLGFFYPEDGGDIFLRYVDSLSSDYTALYPRRYNSL